MSFKPVRVQTAGDGREFLRTPRGIQHKVNGGTLLASAFTDKQVKGGTAVYQNAEGYFVPWPTGAAPEGAEQTAALTAHYVDVTRGNDLCGFIVAGRPREDRCTGVTPEFIAATQGRLIFGL